jgi:hypothetical protein
MCLKLFLASRWTQPGSELWCSEFLSPNPKLTLPQINQTQNGWMQVAIQVGLNPQQLGAAGINAAQYVTQICQYVMLPMEQHFMQTMASINNMKRSQSVAPPGSSAAPTPAPPSVAPSVSAPTPVASAPTPVAAPIPGTSTPIDDPDSRKRKAETDEEDEAKRVKRKLDEVGRIVFLKIHYLTTCAGNRGYQAPNRRERV